MQTYKQKDHLSRRRLIERTTLSSIASPSLSSYQLITDSFLYNVDCFDVYSTSDLLYHVRMHAHT